MGKQLLLSYQVTSLQLFLVDPHHDCPEHDLIKIGKNSFIAQ